MEERRLSSRRPADEEIVFNCVSCGTPDEYWGKTNDISSSGMRLETDHQIETGQLIRIMSEDISDEQRYGSVVWTGKHDSFYLAGVKFVGEDAARDFVWYGEFEH